MALSSRPERRHLRIGDYHAICAITDGELLLWVVHVGHRSTVHKP